MMTTAFTAEGRYEHDMPGDGGWHGYRLGQQDSDLWLEELWYKVRHVIPPGYVADMQCNTVASGDSLAIAGWHFDYLTSLDRTSVQYIWTNCNPPGACPTEWAYPHEVENWQDRYLHANQPTPPATESLDLQTLYRYDARALHRGAIATRRCSKVLVRWHAHGGPGTRWAAGEWYKW